MHSTMGHSIAFAAASAALATQSVSASAPLEPVGAWTLESTDATCLVGRKYGEHLTLGFRKVAGSKQIRIAIWVTEQSGRPIKGNAALSIDQAPSVSAPFSKGSVGPEGLQLIAIDVGRDELPNLEIAKSLRVMAASFDRDFQLRGIGGAISALDKCENDLLTSWGMEPTVLKSIKSRARLKNPNGLFSVNDYPSEALAKHQQGISNNRLLIGVDGRASNCGVVESSGSKALDAKTCEIYVKRARYEPARDANGAAVPSFYFQRMSWEIPG